ncbi:MAG: HAD-IIIA family hydrolase [Syntrophales bacterium]|nr:HAD-IIIA family hydrolase [Syntrophales bacterium]
MSGGIEERLLNKIKRVKLLVLDVDGVMTDGRIVMDDAGLESKQFDVRDGHGLKILMRFGIAVVLLTGRRSRVVEHRAADLGITEVHQGVRNKTEIFTEILRRLDISPEETACVGDDLVDIPLFRRSGFSVAVADAVPEARRIADYVTMHGGGRGAVREVCEVILKAQNRWPDVAARYEFT